MSTPKDQHNPPKNRLLAALPTEEYNRLQPFLELVFLELKQILYAPNEPIEYVYFINDGIVSLITIMENGDTVEVAVVGNEGMVGLPIFLEASTIPGQAYIQIPGSAFMIKTDTFRREVTPGTPLYNLLQRYTQALFNQIAQTAACNRLHSIEERFCRWMLITQDQMGSNQFPLTHEFLSQMLGVRRASVSVVASTMQKAGLISYKRGKMTILDQEGLEDVSCECYGIIKAEFERLVGWGQL